MKVKDKLIDIKDDLWHRFNSLEETRKWGIYGFIGGICTVIFMLVLL